MSNSTFLLYGANGYTGRLITERAAQYGLQPILAGRKEEAIRELAGQFGLPYCVFDLQNAQQLDRALNEVPLLLNCAGPFQYTAKIMLNACLQAKTHYLDITGEIQVFEMAKAYHDRAIEAGILIMPGTGFDVVPTDCLALFLQHQLPDACQLKLAFASIGGSLSHGTAITMTEGLGEGGAVREGGKIIRKPLGHKGMWINIGGKRLFVMAIPWGDVSTSWHTTGIPNIETYSAIKPYVYKLLKLQPLFNWLLRTPIARSYIKRWIDKKVKGPTSEDMQKARTLIWGEVQNTKGVNVHAGLHTPNGYLLTAHSSLIIVKKVLAGNYTAGYQTPAGAYGEDLVLEVPDVTRI